MASSWPISLNRLRNLFKTGVIGTVNGRSAKGLTQALSDVVDSLEKLFLNGVLPVADNFHAVSAVAGLKACPMVHYQTAPALGTATAVHTAIPMTNAAQTITANINSPAVPRALVVSGNALGIAGQVTIYGTNFYDEVMHEHFTLNGATPVPGTLAFKSVTSIVLPAETHAGTDTVTVGTLDVIGLPHMLSSATQLLVKNFDGTTDAGTLAVDDNEVEKNHFTPAGTLDGAKKLDLFYLVG